MLIAKLVIDEDGLPLGTDHPADDDILVRRDLARTILMLSIRRSAIDPKLVARLLPVKNNLLRRIAHPEIRGVSLRFNEDLHRRFERGLGGGCIALLEL